MAIYVKDSNGELKEPTPVANWGGGSELVYPSSAWTRVGDQKYQVWPELPSSQYEGYFNIYDETTLIEFRDRVNAGEISLNALVTADFTMESAWNTPIASGGEYSGIFEGGGHTISNFLIGSSNNGLFDGINSGTVNNLTVTNALITVSADADLIGIIAGISNRGSITNCNVSFDANLTTANGFFGGIVGMAKTGSIISNCSTTGTIIPALTTSTYIIGGIAGEIEDALVENCENNAIIQGTASRVGGICGISYTSEIKNCTNNGSINAPSLSSVVYAAGIAATAETTTFTDCTNNGSITLATSSGGGGIGGRANVGGGIVAQYDDDCTFTNCVNNGTISASTVVEV